MQTRTIGTTGLRTSVVGLGLAALGRPGYVNLGHGDDLAGRRDVVDLEAHTWRVLDAAYERGVRYLDAARSYGRGEAFLGGWLASRRPDDVVVGSKWGYTYTAEWQVDPDGEHEVKDHTLPTFERQWPETLVALGGPPALYLVHSATLDSGILDRPEVLAALADLAEDGVVVGLSLSGPGQATTLERALALTEAGDAPFRSVQATWNLLEPSVGDALAAVADAGWGVVLKEAVANGRLTARGDVPAPLRDLAADLGTSIDALAIAVAAAQPFAPVVLSGAATVDHLDSNLAALGLTLADDVLVEATAHAEDPETYWSTRSGLAWT